jgi:CheY-like chemotaxis protein
MPHVLLVGIGRAFSLVLKPLLRLYGFQVRSVSSGSEALAQIQATIPDLMILEDLLPDMNSQELEQTIQRTLFLQNTQMMDIKRMILIDPTPNVQRMSGYGFGARQCLVKPVNPETLARYSRQLVAICPSFAPFATDEEKLLAQNYQILIVDPDVPIRQFTQIVLENQGYKVEAVSEVEEGLRYLENHRPHLIIAPGHFHELEDEMFYHVNQDPKWREIPFLLLEVIRQGGGLRGDPGADGYTDRWPEPSSLRSYVKRLVTSPSRRGSWQARRQD